MEDRSTVLLFPFFLFLFFWGTLTFHYVFGNVKVKCRSAWKGQFEVMMKEPNSK